MSQQFFVDEYRAAGFSPDGELVAKRSEAFTAIKANATDEQYLTLAEAYYGKIDPGTLTWLRDGFAATDGTFSLVNNEREVALLGALLLAGAVADGDVVAMLAVLSGSVFGAREPSIRPQLVQEAENAVYSASISERRFSPVSSQKLKELPAAKVTAAATAYNENQSADFLVAALKAAATDGRAAAQSVGGETAKIIEILSQQIRNLREEQSILWWLLGGTSNITGKAFTDLKGSAAAVLIGSELASMTSAPGPIAAPALIQRALVQATKGKGSDLSLSDAISSLPEEAGTKLVAGVAVEWSLLTPLHAALVRAQEIGSAPSWHQAFSKAAQFSPDHKLSLLQLSVQVYRERLLLDILSENR